MQDSAFTYVTYALLAIACVGLGVRFHRDADRYKREDFKRYYAEAQVLRDGGNPWHIFEVPQPATTAAPRQVGYPPAFYFLFSPLCRFQPATAHWIWEALQLVSLISALIIALYEIGATASGNFVRCVFAPAFLFPPLHSAFHWGQPTALLLLLLIASWSCARHSRDVSAGMLLAAATLLKIFPWVVGGYFLFRRRWKVLASGVFFALSFSVCLIAFYGVDRSLDFVRGAQVSAIWLDRARNLSIIGNLHSFAFGIIGYPGVSESLFGALAAVACLSLLGISGILTSGLSEESAQASGLCWSLWVVLSILLSPVAWDHYLVLLIPMYIFLAWQLLSTPNGIGLRYDSRSEFPIGLILVGIGLLGFLIVPFFAAARHMRSYLILVLASYAGLCLLLRASKAGASIGYARNSSTRRELRLTPRYDRQ